MKNQPQPVAPLAAAAPELPLKRRVWTIALPAIGENLLQTSLMLVDTLMIARYGPVALAAAAMSGVIVWRVQMTFGCIDRGTMALTARCAGANDKERLGKAVGQSILVALIIGSLMAVAGVWLAPRLLQWMKAEADVVAVGVPYLKILALASLPRMVFAVIAASLRATGDTKSPMWITLWMNVINVLLNFPLIYGIPAVPALGFGGTPGLGLTGSGISTAIALLFSALVAGWLVSSGGAGFRIGLRHFKPHLPTLRTLLKVSFPSFIEECLLSFGFLIFFRFIALLGTAALAAHAISTRIEALSYMAGVGFAIAAAALVGQALGRKDVNQAREAFRLSTKYCVLTMSAVAVLLMVFANPIVRVFAPGHSEIQEMAVLLLIIAAIEQPLLGIAMALGGGLRGAGDTVTPMIASLVCGIGIRVGASWWLAFPMGYGIYGIYLGTLIDWSARAVFLYLFFRWERWVHVKI